MGAQPTDNNNTTNATNNSNNNYSNCSVTSKESVNNTIKLLKNHNEYNNKLHQPLLIA